MVDEAPPSYRPGEQPTLHEILVAEKLDFEAKVQRAAKRKKWLKGYSRRLYKFVCIKNFNLIIANIFFS